MSAPGELFNHPNVFVMLTVDVVDSPTAKLLLTEIYNVETLALNDDYLHVFQRLISLQLENTVGLGDWSRSHLLDARFCTLHCRAKGNLISLRKPSMERLIRQTIHNRLEALHPISVSILIQFKTPAFGPPIV